MAVSVKISNDLKARIQTLADAKRRSPHWVMHEAIRNYVSREEARRDFLEEARKSWQDYQDTGLHITGDELFAWMETWGTEDEAGPPECHT